MIGRALAPYHVPRMDAHRPSFRIGCCAVAFATAVMALAVPSITAAAEGPLIVSARVEAIGPVDENAILEVLELRVGNRLDRQRLQPGEQDEEHQWRPLPHVESHEAKERPQRLS